MDMRDKLIVLGFFLIAFGSLAVYNLCRDTPPDNQPTKQGSP
jgi:hypothetical protein